MPSRSYVAARMLCTMSVSAVFESSTAIACTPAEDRGRTSTLRRRSDQAAAEATARTGGAPGGLDAEEQAAALRDEAFLRGSTDNVTVAVVCARSMSECMVGAV